MTISTSPRARKNSPGFTLIEILISLVVLAIGCLGAIAMQSSAMEGGVQAYNLTVASFLAESEVERLHTLSRGQVLDVSDEQVFLNRDGEPCNPAQAPCYTRTVRVSVDYPTSNSLGLTVAVDFPGRGGPVIYDTFITYLNFTK